VGQEDMLEGLAEIRADYTRSNFLKDSRNPDRLAVLDEFERRIGLTDPLARISLRAAGGVVRSLLAASNILGLDVDTMRTAPGARAPVTDQKARIRNLLDTTIELQEARESFANRAGSPEAAIDTIWKFALASRIGASAKPGADDLFDDLQNIPASIQGIKPAKETGRRPFYEEEIVWLLNERAVLSLAQGDLYAAATMFEFARRANRTLEGECYHPNHCRLVVNRALLAIERGRIVEARRSLVDLRQGLCRGEGDAVSASSGEGRLILALSRGYEALCDDLQGLTERADRSFRLALEELDELRQQRAIAIFQFHHGSMLLQQPEMRKEASQSFARALAAAEAGRHTDIAYRIRVAKAELDRRREAIDAATTLAIHQASIRYAERFEMHRNAVQALGASTYLRLEMGDVEAAAIDCSRALALASRYGMALHRISLRILTGRVLHKRGDIDNARFMFERAASAAERIGYQRAVDLASGQLMRLG
jgi:tetratricopeptide (TPR) repeat protein